MADTMYMLVPITMKKEDWIHVETPNLSLDRAIELQDFIMGRITEITIGDRVINCNSLNKPIVNDLAVVEVDKYIIEAYLAELQDSAALNGVPLLSHEDTLQYMVDNEVPL